jgi:hypothetical protein
MKKNVVVAYFRYCTSFAYVYGLKKSTEIQSQDSHSTGLASMLGPSECEADLLLHRDIRQESSKEWTWSWGLRNLGLRFPIVIFSSHSVL